MQNRDEVIRCAILAAKNDGTEVRNALNDFMRDAGPNTQKLRDVLVALAEGFEATAHSGETYKKRVQAAKDALKAWDGDPATQHACVVICVGSRRLSVPRDLTQLIDTRSYTGQSCIAAVLADSTIGQLHNHEGIMLRAIHLYQQQIAAREVQNSAERIAKLQLEAAEQNKIAEAIRAKARSSNA